jgi:hypothetical protein
VVAPLTICVMWREGLPSEKERKEGIAPALEEGGGICCPCARVEWRAGVAPMCVGGGWNGYPCVRVYEGVAPVCERGRD